MTDPEKLLEFWLDEVGPQGWYLARDDIDAQISEKFGGDWDRACRGQYAHWCNTPRGTLALLILLDQFPRNMFRGSARAFASDHRAIAVTKRAIDRNADLQVAAPERQFFYLPLMHSESMADQDRCVRLMQTRMPATGAGNLVHARAHREVIRRFGRFPYRNEALGRHSTPQEIAYLEKGGYRYTVEQLAAETGPGA